MITPEMINAVRFEVGDLSQELPFLNDDSYIYFLEKNKENIRKASLDAARVIMLNLSINANDRTVDILSIKGGKAAEAYREALRLFLSNPNLNPVNQNLQAYASGINTTEMLENINDPNINAVVPPVMYLDQYKQFPTNPFQV